MGFPLDKAVILDAEFTLNSSPIVFDPIRSRLKRGGIPEVFEEEMARLMDNRGKVLFALENADQPFAVGSRLNFPTDVLIIRTRVVRLVFGTLITVLRIERLNLMGLRKVLDARSKSTGTLERKLSLQLLFNLRINLLGRFLRQAEIKPLVNVLDRVLHLMRDNRRRHIGIGRNVDRPILRGIPGKLPRQPLFRHHLILRVQQFGIELIERVVLVNVRQGAAHALFPRDCYGGLAVVKLHRVHVEDAPEHGHNVLGVGIGLNAGGIDELMIGVVLLQPLNKLIRPASFRKQTTANGLVRKLVNGNAALLFRLEQAPTFRPRNFLKRIGIV